MDYLGKSLPRLDTEGADWIKERAGFTGTIEEYSKRVRAEIYRNNLKCFDGALRDRVAPDEKYLFNLQPPRIDAKDNYYNITILSPLFGRLDKPVQLDSKFEDEKTQAFVDSVIDLINRVVCEATESCQRAYTAAEEIARNMGDDTYKDLVLCRKIQLPEQEQAPEQGQESMTPEEWKKYKEAKKMEKARQENPLQTPLEEILAAYFALEYRPASILSWKGSEEEREDLKNFIEFVISTYTNGPGECSEFGFIYPLITGSSGIEPENIYWPIDATSHALTKAGKQGNINTKTGNGKRYYEQVITSARISYYQYTVLMTIDNFLSAGNTEISLYKIATEINSTPRKVFEAVQELRKVDYYRKAAGMIFQDYLLNCSVLYREGNGKVLVPYLRLNYRPKRHLPALAPAFERRNVVCMSREFFNNYFLPASATESELAIVDNITRMAGNRTNRKNNRTVTAGLPAIAKALGYDGKSSTARTRQSELVNKAEQVSERFKAGGMIEGYIFSRSTGDLKITAWPQMTENVQRTDLPAPDPKTKKGRGRGRKKRKPDQEKKGEKKGD